MGTTFGANAPVFYFDDDPDQRYHRILNAYDPIALGDDGLYMTPQYQMLLINRGANPTGGLPQYPGTYNHLVVTMSPAFFIGETVYLNGTFALGHSGSPDMIRTHYLNFFLDEDTEYANGRIALLRVYDHTLTAEEVFALYNDGNPFPKTITALSLVSPDVTGIEGSTVPLEAELTDAADSTPIPDTSVDFFADGVQVGSATTDSFGVATFDYTIPNGTSLGEHTFHAEFGGDGSYIDALSDPGTLTVLPSDTAPPTTEPTLSGQAGGNGWYLDVVSVTLTATDNLDGSGVKQIVYSLDGGAPITVSGDTATVSVTGDGSHTLRERRRPNRLRR
jgi:hypothetical protein